MKIKKSLFSVCLSILFIAGSFVPCINVQAAGNTWTNQMNYGYFNDHFYKIEEKLDGIIWNIDDLQTDFYNYIDDTYGNSNNYTNYQTWIGDHMSGTYQNGDSGTADVSFDQTLRQALRAWSSAYIEANTGYQYVYSFASSQYRPPFSSDEVFNKFLTVFNDNLDKQVIVNFNGNELWVLDDEVQFVYRNYSTNYAVYSCSPYYNSTLGHISSGKHYFWSTTISDYTYTTFNAGAFLSGNVNLRPETTGSNGIIDSSYMNYQITNLNTTQYLMYMSSQAASNGSKGIQDYYISGSYNTSIIGSYNTTTTVIDNSITATEVNNYIYDYHDTNGDWPTPQEITIHIEIWRPDPSPTPTPDPNPTPTPGPGGGGDNDDDNPSWDLSWLGRIGEILGQVISAIGNVIAGILEAITSIFTSITEGIPNVIGAILEYTFPFLPDEIVALISLSILLMVLVGIVRLIRG